MPRRAPATKIEFFNTEPPFSNFAFIDSKYNGLRPLRRLFSQARSLGYGTFIVEDISPTGLLAEENEDIAFRHPSYIPGEVKRITFWKDTFNSEGELAHVSSDSLIGYAILKHDQVPSIGKDAWHIYESIFRFQPSEQICIKTFKRYNITCGSQEFPIEGILYCQQNELNKACAQVAMRTLLSNVLPQNDIGYREIHNRASCGVDFNPARGLNSEQIRNILSSLGFTYRDIDYHSTAATLSKKLGFSYYSYFDKSIRSRFPYSKFIYSGIESGYVVLVGFSFSGPEANNRRHIIPFFGHTFNKNTWVPNAELGYFHVGERTKYLPSESWLDSFIGHDDNFGSNFFLPRQYLDSTNVEYVISILPNNVTFDGVSAEAMAADIIYTVLPHIQKESYVTNYWLKQLFTHVGEQSIVFRALSLSSIDYVKHLENISDWQGNKEKGETCSIMKSILPPMLWVVEMSLPELFPVNYRKLGELVFDASLPADQSFIFARIPETYLMEVADNAIIPISSTIKSHTSLAKAFL